MTRQRILEDDVQAVESYVSRVASADSIEDLQGALETNRESFEESSDSLEQWFHRVQRQQDAKYVDGVSDDEVKDEFSEELQYDEWQRSNESPDEVSLIAERCADDVSTVVDRVETLDGLQDTASDETVVEMTAELESEMASFKDDLALLLGQLG